ncbi:MAG: RNA pseudouridine synthase [Saprospiraceae bacterium]|nr:RNA pseudouridine synthase [Saprospiraceae bacterium]
MSQPFRTVPILLETTAILVVNKPAGMAVERLAHGYPSVEDWALRYIKGETRKPYVGIVHRLDRPVSGVLLLSKKRSALKVLNLQFAERSVEKIYHAIVENPPESSSGLLTHWLIKDVKEKRAVTAAEGASGAVRCELKFKVLETVPRGTLLEIRPLQGRYHQIRAQLAAAGMPIVGDARYGAVTPFRRDCIALHAYSLSFRDPFNDKLLTVTAKGFPG